MKKSIFLILLFANVSFANGYDDCMDRAYGRHQADLDTAKEIFKKQSEDCFRFPDGEEHYACQFKAKETFDKEVEKANIRLNFETKNCQKYPW